MPSEEAIVANAAAEVVVACYPFFYVGWLNVLILIVGVINT
jgi:hypothetical protein